MFDKEKLDQLFGQLAVKTESCKDILEFKKIANPVVQEAIDAHLDAIQTSAEIYTDFLREVAERLKLCMPTTLPYVPVLVVTPDQQLQFAFMRKGAKLPLTSKTTPTVH
jgi:hypothetical protein